MQSSPIRIHPGLIATAALVVHLAMCMAAHAQQPFKNTYGRNQQHERAFAHRPTSDGGHIIVGTKYSTQNGAVPIPGGYGIELVKTHPDGSIQWRRHYRMSQLAPDMDAAVAMAVKERSGGQGYVVTGYVYAQENPTNKDIFLLLVTAGGTFPTFSIFDGGESLDDIGQDVIETNAAGGPGFLIVGGVNATPGALGSQYEQPGQVIITQGDLCYIKTDAAGGLQWSKIINDPALYVPPDGSWEKRFTWGYSVVETDDAFVAVGMHNDRKVIDPWTAPIANSHLYMVKLNKATQNVVWTKTYPDPAGSYDVGYSVVFQDHGNADPADDEYVVLGSSYRNNSDANGSYVSTDMYLVTTNRNGVPQTGRNKIYYDRGEDVGRYLAHADLDGDGTNDSYVCAGPTTSFSNNTHNDIYVQHITYNGGLLPSSMTRVLEGQDEDLAYSVAQDDARFFSIAGTSNSFAFSGNDDMYLARVEPQPNCSERCGHLELILVSPEAVNHDYEIRQVISVQPHPQEIDAPIQVTSVCPECSDEAEATCSNPNAYQFQHQTTLDGYFIDRGMSCIQTQLDGHYVHGGHYAWTSAIVDTAAQYTSHKTSIMLRKTSSVDGTNVWNRYYVLNNWTSIGYFRSPAANDIIEAFDNSLLMSGSFTWEEGGYPNRMDSNACLFKVDAYGNLSPGLWFMKAYGLISIVDGAGYQDVARSVRETPDDVGYIMAGYSNSPFNASTPSDYNVYVIKTDRNGNCRPATTDEWAYVYGGDHEDRGMSVRVCLNSSGQEDGYIVAGYSNSFSDVSDGIRDFDIYLLRLENDGTVRWSQTYGTPGNDLGYDLVIADDGGFVITGIIDDDSDSDPATVSNDLFVLKVSDGGTPEWSFRIDRSTDDQGRSIVRTNEGGYAVAGCTVTEEYGRQMYLLKLTGCFDVEWSSAFPTPSSSDPFVADEEESDWAEDLVQTTDGGYLVIGTSRSYYDISTSGTPLTATPIPPLPPDTYHIQEHMVKTGCEGQVCLSEDPGEMMYCYAINIISPSTEEVSIVEDLEIEDVDMEIVPPSDEHRICPDDDRPPQPVPSGGSQGSELGAVSGIRSATGTLQPEQSLDIRPTPIKAGTTLTVTPGEGLPSHCTLSVTDVAGRIVYSTTLSSDAGRLGIDTKGWQPGTYLIAVRDGETPVSTGKVVIVK